MADLEETVKNAEAAKSVEDAVAAADIVRDAVNALSQAYGNNVVSVFRPGRKKETSDYDIIVVMKDSANIPASCELLKRYSREKVHFYVHKKSDYDNVHDFKTPVVVEPASIENWRGLVPTYQFAWEIRTTDPDNKKAKEVYVGEEFVREQKPKAVNLHANPGEGIELIITQLRCAFEAYEKKDDAAIAKSVLRTAAGIHMALNGEVIVTDEELLAMPNVFSKEALGQAHDTHESAKKIRQTGKGSFADDVSRYQAIYTIFGKAMSAAGMVISERPDIVWNMKRNARMADYYAHNTEKLVECIKQKQGRTMLPLLALSAESLLWYLHNGEKIDYKQDIQVVLEDISKQRERFMDEKIETFYLPVLAEMALIAGDTEKAKSYLDNFETRQPGFNPRLSEIKARRFCQTGHYEAAIAENPLSVETWSAWSQDENTSEADAIVYSAIAEALDRRDMASLLFSEHGAAAKRIFFKPWQEKLMRVSESVLALFKQKREDCLDSVNKYETFSPKRELELMLTTRLEQASLAEKFARQIRELESRVQRGQYADMSMNQDCLEKITSEFWQQMDLQDARHATDAKKYGLQKSVNMGPERLEITHTSISGSSRYFGYAAAGTMALVGAGIASVVPSNLQVYLEGATAIALPIFFATGLWFAFDLALPRNALKVKKGIKKMFSRKNGRM